MFKGVVHANVRSVILDLIPKLPAKAINVCSGNFTIETTLRMNGYKGRIEGCDVSLYTCALGAYFTGQDLGIKLYDDADPDLEVFRPYLLTPHGAAAVVAILLDMSEHAARNNEFQKRMWRTSISQAKQLVEGTMARLEKKKAILQLDAFHAKDGVEVIRDAGAEPETFMISFPPTYCLAPENRLLTADLRWVPCGDLSVGDKLLAFDEYPQPGVRCRRWRFSTVTHSEPKMAECVKVHLENGESITCTADHPWLADRYSYCSGIGTRKWVRADRLLEEAPYVIKMLNTWDEDRSYQAGWLAGMYDGEGCIAASGTKRGFSWNLSLAQKAGTVMDRAFKYLSDMGFDPAIHGGRPADHLMVRGGLPEAMRVLGTLRPVRLLNNFQKLDGPNMPSLRTQRPTRVKVLWVEPGGLQRIQSISTSTRTYVGEGYAMHNTNGYEKLYAWLDSQISWRKPTYQNIGQEADFARIITGIKGIWALGTEYRNEAVEQIVGMPIAQASRGAAKNVYLYSSLKTLPLLVRRAVECTEANWARLTDADEIGPKARVKFHRVSFKEANYFRQLFSSVIPMQASAQWCYVFTLDGKVFGQVMLSLSEHDLVVDGKNIGSAYLYLMSDLPVASEKHKRLSKLVLAILTSKEMRAELEHRSMQAVEYVLTTAFSHNPASMKYRGAFKFHARKQNDKGVWQINYLGTMGERTMRALFAEWYQRQYKSKGQDE